MNRKFLIGAVAVLAIGTLATWLLLRPFEDIPSGVVVAPFDEREQEIHEANARLQSGETVSSRAPEPLPLSRSVRLAIGNVGLAEESQVRAVGDLVVAGLTGARGIETVERQDLDAVLRELQLNLSGLVRAGDAVRAGKLLRADWFLLGTAAPVNGTNSLVVRIVDARVGTLQDAAALPAGRPPAELAADLVAFVRRSRERAADPGPRMYLAIGTFLDLSHNNRQPALPRQLRAYLTAAYQGGGQLTLLEREFVNVLLQELQLDLAGLTDGGGTNAPLPMASAYWLVDGEYQSYETAGLEVEIALNVRRMFGRSHRRELRGPPDESFFRRVRETVDDVMKQDLGTLMLSRVNEAHAQYRTGKDLLQGVLTDFHGLVHDWGGYSGGLSDGDMERSRRNLEEAIRSFETVLLLEPGHPGARAGLAECFQKTMIGRTDEARELYRGLIDAGTSQFTSRAQSELWFSFRRESPESRRRWYETAARISTNPIAVVFFQAEASRAMEDTVLQQQGTSEASRVAEKRLLEAVNKRLEFLRGGTMMVDFEPLKEYADTFGTNQAVAAERLAQLLPRLQEAVPDLAPHLLAGVAAFQTDTNSPVFAQFEQSLSECVARPEKVPHAKYYFRLISRPLAFSLEKLKLFALGAKVQQARQSAAARGLADRLDDLGKMRLAYNHANAGQWSNALAVFQSYSNRPVVPGVPGLWGKTFDEIILTGRWTAHCRMQLGLPPEIDPREFQMSTNLACLHSTSRFGGSAFTVADGGIWFAVEGRLTHVDFELKTNAVVPLPLNPHMFVTAICPGTSNVWIGTRGDGLIEVDKATRQARALKEKDGLLMDIVSALARDGDTLWIGYGSEEVGAPQVGALGRLNLRTRASTTFTPPLSGQHQRLHDPVTTIIPRSGDEVWFVAGRTAQRHRVAGGVLEPLLPSGSRAETCLAAGEELLAIGRQRISQMDIDVELETRQPGGGISRTNLLLSEEEVSRLQAAARTNRSLKVNQIGIGAQRRWGDLIIRGSRDPKNGNVMHSEPLPNEPTTVMVNGRDVWVGGAGFIALVDAASGRIRKIAYIPACRVDQIQLGGGYVWARYNAHLHRAPLSELQ